MWVVIGQNRASMIEHHHLYLKCQKRNGKFFQWIDEPPRGLAEDILIKRVIVKELF